MKRSALALAVFGLLGGACSATAHDCYETRDCPEPTSGDDGSAQGGRNAGSGGRLEPALGKAGASEAGGSSAISDGGSAGEGEAEALRILSVNPSDGALGVAQDAQIVITFNRAMDTAATEAAYESSDLPATALGFSWNESATVLTLSPRAPLQYAVRTEGVDEGLEFPALAYHFGFDERAADQSGQPLVATHFTFSTLRQVSVELDAEPSRTGNWTLGEGEGIHNCLRMPKAGYVPTVCVGDDLNNVRYSGFLSFDLSGLPEDIAQFSDARLRATAAVHGVPAELGASQLEHVVYGELGETALAVAPLSAPNPLFVVASLLDDARLELDSNVTAALSDDYEHRAERAARCQYRLSFPRVLANAHWDDVELPTSSIHLAFSYLVP